MKYHVDFEIDLKRNPYQGMYIAIEGIDGSGKTAQTQRVTDRLKELGIDAVATKEPWDEGFIGSIVRKNILSGKTKLSPIALQYLFVADRADHLEKLVIPALKNSKTVVTDRYLWSSIPYGLLDRGNTDYSDKDVILCAFSILSFYHQFIVPNYTFYLDISVETAVERIEQKHHAKEIYEKKGKLIKIREGYNWLLKKFPGEFAVVNGEQSVEKVTEDILMRINTNINTANASE